MQLIYPDRLELKDQYDNSFIITQQSKVDWIKKIGTLKLKDIVFRVDNGKYWAIDDPFLVTKVNESAVDKWLK